MKTSLRLNHQNIHFIGCTHFGHSNVIKFDKRPFDDIEAHDKELIENWNKKVGKKDIVFHIGDISYKSPNNTNIILEQLNGDIYLIAGNHDKMKDVSKLTRIKECFNGLDLFVADKTADDTLKDQQHIHLYHYPVLSWNRSHYNSWHIHSHTHQNLMKDPFYDWYYKRKVIDVGVNGINYEPISYAEVKEIMVNKKVEFLKLDR